MSDRYEEFSGDQHAAHKVCRVAYTLNDRQPVVCTYIGDQPFFYMDYADDVEDMDDDLFTPSELGFLSEEIDHLKSEIAEFDRLSFYFSENDEVQALLHFSENAESFAADGLLTRAEIDQQLVRLTEILAMSRMGSAYLTVAEKHKIEIIASRQVEFAFYDRRNGSITINPDLAFTDQILLLSRELRRHWQHRQGVLINPLMFQPENAIVVNRAQEADLTVSMIRIAWELQLAGMRDVWERVENSPMADLARSFSREAFLDFRTINNGVASTAVFESWFLSERCRQQDRKIIQAMLADYRGYVFENAQSSEKVSAELISGLGSVPFGKNYLAAYANTIMTDPIFTEVRDRSNANFLWFIKFEKSFKQTEQHLQTESDLSTHDTRHGSINTRQDLHNGIARTTADIVQLFDHQSRQGPREAVVQRDGSGKRSSAQVIDLRRWSGK